MEFVVTSKYDVGAEVVTHNNHCAKVIDVKLNIVGRVLKFNYLLEFEDGTRTWQEEETLE